MSRLFFKTVFTSFLWLILLINLLYAFDFIRDVSAFSGLTDIDYQNSYFGFSSLLNAFKNLGTSVSWLQPIEKLKNDIWNIASSLLKNEAWDFSNLNFSSKMGVVDGFLETLKFIGQVIGAFFLSVSSVFVFLAGIVVWIFYMLCTIFGFTYAIFGFMSGAYHQEVPPSLILNSFNVLGYC